MGELPSREKTANQLERWGNSKEAFGFFNDFADIIGAYASDRLVDREAIDREAMTRSYADWHGTDWADVEGMAACARLVDFLLDAALGDTDEL